MSGQFRVDAARRPARARTPGCSSTSTPAPSCASSTSGCSAGCRCRRAAPSSPPRSPTSAATRSTRSSTSPPPRRRIRARRTGIKRALLDQQLVSGIGNIYADEALWLARTHYARGTWSLSAAKAAEILIAATTVMSRALAVGGTSFDALYVNVNGSSGYFDRALAVYGQEGRPCPRCGDARAPRALHEPVVLPLPALPARARRLRPGRLNVTGLSDAVVARPGTIRAALSSTTL